MRKLLYAFVFASILLLAGSSGLASFDEPGDGGTLPEYQVWLPVVKISPPCEFDLEISSPPEGATYQWGDTIPTHYSWQRVDVDSARSYVVFILRDPKGKTWMLSYWNTGRSGEHSEDLSGIFNYTKVGGQYTILGSATCDSAPDGLFKIERTIYVMGGPEYRVWLPVVGKHTAPHCRIAEMGYSHEIVKPKPDLPEKHLHVFWVRNSDPFYPSDGISATARIYIGTGEQLGEALMYPNQTIPPPHDYLSVKFDEQFLESEKSYFWQARIDCRGEGGSWTNPQNITAGQ